MNIRIDPPDPLNPRSILYLGTRFLRLDQKCADLIVAPVAPLVAAMEKEHNGSGAVVVAVAAR